MRTGAELSRPVGLTTSSAAHWQYCPALPAVVQPAPGAISDCHPSEEGAETI
jgi:hypothetical protein